jgi:hypothetical protein
MVKSRYLLLTAVLTVVNCATYKQLKPKPAIQNHEGGSIELKKGDKNFELKKDKKYFIAFPAPEYDHFYLVVTSPQKQKFTSTFTGDFVKQRPGKLVADETWAPDTMSIYPVDKSRQTYYWLIEQVPQKIEEVRLRYRYAPQWRFKFEHKYASYKEILAKNVVDRGVYRAIGATMNLEGFNFALVIDTVGRHTAELQNLQKELLSLENIFPPNVVNSTDVAYLNYRKLKGDLDEEIAFQTNYAAALNFFYREYQTRGNDFAFLGHADDFIAYFSMKDKLAQNVAKESQRCLQKRLAGVPSFFDQRLQAKDDAKPLDTSYFRLGALARLGELHTVSGLSMTPDLSAVARFMSDFDAKSRRYAGLRDSLDRITKYVKEGPNMPPDDFFKGVNARIGALQAMVPAGIGDSYGKYQNFACARKLNEVLGAYNTELLKQIAQYRDAENIVKQLNVLKAQRDYSTMIGILKQNAPLGFLIDKYRDLDKMSIDEQAKNISAALAGSAWASAEGALKKLHADRNFLDPSMLTIKEGVVHDYEDSLYSKVERMTRARVNKFCDSNVTTYENIDSLYADSVFLPVYDITFSSGTRNDLVERKDKLVADLARMKDNEFPARSIKLLYEQYVKTPEDNGVLKARAIVAHGKHYAGDDKEIKYRMSEADPLLAKWITKPKEYRRVLVVPVSDNRHGKNKYIVRFNINVPTDAVFPVYDVNIKLPKEVAQNAAATQWYESISCNKKLLKSEGRFSITAPTSANGYECQITPVQMNKDQANFLEIVFDYNAFKVLPVSVMVQKPIIKKN